MSLTERPISRRDHEEFDITPVESQVVRNAPLALMNPLRLGDVGELLQPVERRGVTFLPNGAGPEARIKPRRGRQAASRRQSRRRHDHAGARPTLGDLLRLLPRPRRTSLGSHLEPRQSPSPGDRGSQRFSSLKAPRSGDPAPSMPTPLVPMALAREIRSREIPEDWRRRGFSLQLQRCLYHGEVNASTSRRRRPCPAGPEAPSRDLRKPAFELTLPSWRSPRRATP